MTVDWHLPTLLSLVIASLVLTFVFAYLWRVYRKRYLALWGLASLFYLAQFSRYLFDPPAPSSLWRLLGFTATSLGSALLIHTACRALIGLRASRAAWGAGAAAFAATAACRPTLPPFLALIPAMFVAGALIILSGATVLRRVEGSRTGRAMVGWSLTAWGMVAGAVPLYVRRPELLPACYVAASLLFQATGIGALLLFFERRGEQLRVELADKEALLREKDVLLREVHHRVKNNLQIMRSLFSLQAAGCSGEAAGVLDVAQSRIDSMAMIHEDFYQAAGVTGIEIGRYARRLLARLRARHDPDGRAEYRVEAAPTFLDVDRMVPLGQFLNEAMTNALVHGLNAGRRRAARSAHDGGANDGAGHIAVTVARTEGTVEVAIRDDGPGLAAGTGTRPEGVGLPLLRSLADQLHGDLTLENDGGLVVRLSFPTERGD